MSTKKLDQLIQEMEHYVECWKQFSHYIGVARSKQFTQDDEDQFLEIKSAITQQLELILASLEGGVPPKEEIHQLMSEAPSVRFMSELSEGGIKTLENKWHKLYLGWQSTLGQLKVAQRQAPPPSRWNFFRRK